MDFNKEYLQNLLYEKMAGTITVSEEEIVNRAIAEDPEIKKEWLLLQEKFATAKGKSTLETLDVGSAWNSTVAKINARNSARPRQWIAIGIAATLLLAIPAYLFLQDKGTAIDKTILKAAHKTQDVYMTTAAGKSISLARSTTITLGKAELKATAKVLSLNSTPASEDQQWATLVVPPTKDYQLKLADGTIVTLNSGSSLKFPLQFGKGERKVYLQGEAFFEVTKSKTQQFIVQTDQAAVKVYGTSFNVNSFEEGNFAVSLVSGTVAAQKDAQLLMLQPGQQAVLYQKHLKTTKFDEMETLAWMKGAYYFHNQPLSEISKVIQRWFDVEVTYNSQEISKKKFTGAIYKNQPLQEVIQNLSISAGLSAKLSHQQLIFK